MTTGLLNATVYSEPATDVAIIDVYFVKHVSLHVKVHEKFK